MKHLEKSELQDGSIYEGYSNDTSSFAIARWDALNNRFNVNTVSWNGSFDIPMVFPGDETEYFGIFYPFHKTEIQK